ncbi:MAG: aerobic carbon-monoxide dehydrogenase large subunit [Alphaproteobacteria bacterium]|nr:aerobic carbon-monoxide dehydrogenase large subunit [Alphaproteobacteria bacterium]
MNVTNTIGTRLPRLEDERLLTGKGRYLDDLPSTGALAAAFARSPYAHAKIVRIDEASTLAMPGVRAVFTLDSLSPALAQKRMPIGFRSSKLPANVTPHVLADGEVAYVGQAVAVVLADNRYLAEDAAAMLEIEYEQLPALVDCREALKPHAPPVRSDHPSAVVSRFDVQYGDVDKAFAGAAHVISEELWQHRGAAHPIECRGILVRHDPNDDLLLVWSSTQMPHELYYMAAHVLGLDENRLRVATPEVGGGFGVKYAVYPEELAAIAAALISKRDIKWVEDRKEHFVASSHERDQYWRVEAAFDRSGKILGVRGDMIHDQGAYTYQDINVAYNSATSLPGPYVLPAYRLQVTVAQTNKTPAMPVRAAGYPQGCFAMERLMDRAATVLNMDRAEIRRCNLVPAASMPYLKPLRSRSGAPICYDSGDFPAVQNDALIAADWNGFPKRQAAARTEGRYLGIGIAHGVKGTGRGPFETGLVRIMPSGRISVFTGAAAMGQGLQTALSQICAAQLGISPDQVSVVTGDTRTVPIGLGGFGSRQLIMAGSSVQLAAKAVRGKVLKLASHLLEASEEDLDLSEGHVHVVGTPPASGISLAQIANILRGSPGAGLPPGIEPGCDATFNFRSDQLSYADVCHVAEVEVDIDTAMVRIVRYVAVQDSGTLINPLIVDGQVFGSVAHGIGNALYEWMGYDADGNPVTTDFGTYLMATSTEMPPMRALYRQTPTPLNPLGAKGVGEVGTVPVAAAVISAVEHALQPFGVHLTRAPIDPVYLLGLIKPEQR